MPDALSFDTQKPPYLGYFELQRHPFAKLDNPAELFLTEQYSYLSAHLANTTEDSDMLVVICGQPGSGKTSLLARFGASVYEEICLATIDDRCGSARKFFALVLGQFGFGEITGTTEQLRHICQEFLKQQGKGDPVVLMVDNAHLLTPKIFEELRWMAGIRHNDQPIVNLVLAGHPDLAKIMESPAMSQISKQKQVHFTIRAYTADETANYVWHRLELAGGRQNLHFSDEANSLIYRFTGGTPGLINTLCHGALEELHNRKKKSVSGAVVRSVAESLQLVPHVVPIQNKSRRRTDPGYVEARAVAGRPARQKPVPAKAQPRPGKSSDATSNGDQATGSVRKISRPDPQRESAETQQPAEGKTRSAAGALSIVEKIASLSEQLGDLRARKNDLELELNHRDQTIASLEDQLEESRRARSALLKELDHQGGTKGDLQSQLDSAQGELGAKTAAIDELEKRVASLSAQLTEAQRNNDSLGQQLSSETTRAEDLQKQADHVRSVREALSERDLRISDLQSALIERDNQIMSARLNAQEQESTIRDLQAGKHRIEELQSELAAGEAKAGELQGQLDDSLREFDSLRKQLEQREVELRALQDAAGIDEGADSAHEINRQISRVRELEDELQSAQDLNAATQKHKQELTDSNRELRSKVAELSEQTEHEQNVREEAEHALELMEKRMAAREETADNLKADIRVAREEKEWLQTEIDRLRNVDEKLQATSRSLEQANQELGEKRDRLDAASCEITELKAELSSLRDESEKLAVAEQRSNESKQLLEQELGDAESEKERLQNLNTELRNELDSARSELKQNRDLISRNSDIAGQLEESSAEIAALTKRLAEEQEAHESARSAAVDLGELQAELAELAKLTAGSESAGETEQELARLDAELAGSVDAQQQLDTLVSKLRKDRPRLGDLAVKFNQLNAELEQSRAEIDELNRKLAGSQEESAGQSHADGLRVELDAQATETARLTEELRAARENLNEMQKEFVREAEDNHELQSQLLALADVEERLREQLMLGSEMADRLAEEERERVSLQAEIDALRRQHGDEPGEVTRRIAASDPAPTSAGFRLVVCCRDQVVESIRLQADRNRVLIGRADKNDIIVESEFVSRHHLLISLDRNQLYVEDLNSTNGTLLNNERVMKNKLEVGDVLAIGEYEVRIMADEADA